MPDSMRIYIERARHQVLDLFYKASVHYFGSIDGEEHRLLDHYFEYVKTGRLPHWVATYQSEQPWSKQLVLF